MKRKPFHLCLSIALAACLCLLGLLALHSSIAHAADNPALPPRPTLTPPSAPTVEPMPAPTPTPVAQPAETPLPVQATLLLYAGPGYDGAWTVVQWQGVTASGTT